MWKVQTYIGEAPHNEEDPIGLQEKLFKDVAGTARLIDHVVERGDAVLDIPASGVVIVGRILPGVKKALKDEPK